MLLASDVGVAPGEAISNQDFLQQLETLNEELEVLNAQARDLEHANQRPPRHDVQSEDREQETSCQAAEFLIRLHLACRLLDLRRRQHAHFLDARHDARHLLDGAEGRAIGERKHQRRDDGRAP